MSGPHRTRGRVARALAAALLVLLAGLGLPACRGPRLRRSTSGAQWASAATEDLRFIEETLQANHPGALDEQNPSFRAWMDTGLEESLALAARAHDYPGYHFAVARYVLGFRDSHLQTHDRYTQTDLVRGWPGLVLAYRNGVIVVDSARAEGALADGDVLVSCDGQSVDELTSTLLQPYVCDWAIEGRRPQCAPWLLVDLGNPFVPRPERCIFERAGAGGPVEVALAWRDIDLEQLQPLLERASQAAHPSIGARRAGDDGWWISLSSFETDPDTSSALEAVVAAIRESAEAMRGARFVVLDVRGNGGGSSSWGTRIASALWSESYVQSIEPESEAVEWRASDGNVRYVRDTLLPLVRRRLAQDEALLAHMERVHDGLEAALESGAPMFRLPRTEALARPVVAPPETRARVFLLTDGACVSACLDFADLVLGGAGATQIGRATGADTSYMEVRAVSLPSRQARLHFAMKVYRGRARGDNQGYVPTAVFGGDLRDDAALEAWARELARQPSESTSD